MKAAANPELIYGRTLAAKGATLLAKRAVFAENETTLGARRAAYIAEGTALTANGRLLLMIQGP